MRICRRLGQLPPDLPGLGVGKHEVDRQARSRGYESESRAIGTQHRSDVDLELVRRLDQRLAAE